jgi:DNA repair protein SbcC/Rad50
MLEEIRLRNFQKHGKLRIKFDPRITVIAGKTEAGKSSIIRALRWVCQNVPSGKAFIGRFGKAPFASVKLVLDGGRSIIRKRSNGGDTNIYRLDGQVSKAFGSAVPAPIDRRLSLSDWSFQSQHDAPFWFTESTGQVARNLNEVVNLTLIDNVLGIIASEVRDAKATERVCEARVQEANEERRALRWVVGFEEALTGLEALATRRAHIAQQREQLVLLIKTGQSLAKGQEALRIASREAGATLALAHTLRGKSKRVQALRKAIKKAERLAGSLLEEVPDLTELEAVRERADQIAERRRRFEEVAEQAADLQKELTEIENELEESEQELHQGTKGRCPVCGKKMPSP